MNQGSGREEADGEPLLAGRQTETEGDMGLLGVATAESLPVPELPSAMIFSRRSTYSHRANSRTSILLSDAMALKSKLSRLLTAGNLACLSDPPLDHAALTVDQFQLGQTDKIPHMVGALGGALAGQLVVFAQERGAKWPAVSGS